MILEINGRQVIASWMRNEMDGRSTCGVKLISKLDDYHEILYEYWLRSK